MREQYASRDFTTADVLEGAELLGCYVGTEEGEAQFIVKKVGLATEGLERLVTVGRHEPQGLYTIAAKSQQHKLTYLQRCLGGSPELLLSCTKGMKRRQKNG